MATITPDPINNYRGRIGKISYYIRQSENMARKSSSNGKVSDSEAAVEQRWKFKKLVETSMALAAPIKVGFPQRKKGYSAMNMFVSVNKDVCTVEADRVSVDYERLQCAGGSLALPEVTVRFNAEEQKITFVNTRMEEMPYCSESDQVYGVVLETQRGWSKLVKIQQRGEDGEVSVVLPSQWDFSQVAVYAFALSANGKKASPSVYLSVE